MENLILSCLESRVESRRNFYGRFLLGPFAPGHGITVATALRRSLLAELDGVTISAVEIDGVTHEFATIQGMRESVLDLSLNLKNIVLMADSYLSTPDIGYLQMQGPGVVTASDLKLPYGIRCVDPDQYLATLSSDGSLAFKFVLSRLLCPLTMSNLQSYDSSTTICKFQSEDFMSVPNPHDLPASGFETTQKQEDRERQGFQLGISQKRELLSNRSRVHNSLRHVLLLDSVFSPVNRVNFLLETDNLSQKPRDRVLLEVWTNGSMTPRQAIHQASLSLIRLFSNLDQTRGLLAFHPISSQKSLKLFPPHNTHLVTLDIGNLPLSLKTYTHLKLAGIHTLFDLTHSSPDKLLKIEGIGKEQLKTIEKNLLSLGLSLIRSE